VARAALRIGSARGDRRAGQARTLLRRTARRGRVRFAQPRVVGHPFRQPVPPRLTLDAQIRIDDEPRPQPSQTSEQVHEAKARLAAIIESSDDAIISKSLDGVIESWNQGAERLFGYAVEEVIGASILKIIPVERAEEETAILARLRAGERVGHFETVRVAKDGRRVDVSLSISPIHDSAGRVIGASKVARDITLEKQAREVLRETDRTKDEFLAILGHELRNRLAPIRNAMGVLAFQEPPTREAKLALAVVDRQVAQMVQLVEDLLDVSRITRSELALHRERVTLQDVIRDALELSRPLIRERGHRLHVSKTPLEVPLDADRARLVQAVSNLLDNAARYTEPGGQIWLVAAREGDHAVVSVRDDGIGISSEALPRLFEMFQQGRAARERSQGGLGVGLTLVKRIVQLHGGLIEARSAGLGAGSEFSLRLPVAKQTTLPRPRSSGVRRILIVDVDRDLVRSLAMSLASLGNDVRTACNGPESLAVAAAFRPHAVALDVSLPTLDGFQVARQLRKEAWGDRIALVGVTGWSQKEAWQRAMEAGFDHLLVKPVDAAMLTSVLDALFAGIPRAAE
jgi:PAS domain S-box-containing protein